MDSSQASTLLVLFSPLLRKSAKIVPEKVKVNLMKIIGDLMCLIPDLRDRQTSTYQKTYTLLSPSQLFQSLRSHPRESCINFISTFHQFTSIDLGLQGLAQLLEGMNAYSTKRIDEPDWSSSCRFLGLQWEFIPDHLMFRLVANSLQYAQFYPRSCRVIG